MASILCRAATLPLMLRAMFHGRRISRRPGGSSDRGPFAMTSIPRRIRAAPRHVTRRQVSAGLQTRPLGKGGPFPVARWYSGHAQALFRAHYWRPASTGAAKFSNPRQLPPSTDHEHGYRLDPHDFRIVLNLHHKKVLVAADVEHNPIAPDKTGAGVLVLDVLRRFPGCRRLLIASSLKWDFGVGASLLGPELSQGFPGNHPHRVASTKLE